MFSYEIKPIKVKANTRVADTIKAVVADLMHFETNNTLNSQRRDHLTNSIAKLKKAVASYDRTFLINPEVKGQRIILSLERLIAGLQNEVSFMKNMMGYQSNDMTKIWIKQLTILAEAFQSPKQSHFSFAEPVVKKQVFFPVKPTVRKVPLAHTFRKEKQTIDLIDSIYENYTGRKGLYLTRKKSKEEVELDGDIHLTSAKQHYNFFIR